MDGTSAPPSHIGVTSTSYSDLMFVEQEQGLGLALSLGHTLGLNYKRYQLVLKVPFSLFQAYSVKGRKEQRTGYGHVCGGEGYRKDEESQRAKFTRDALNHLLKMVESRMRARHRNAIFDELLKLMLQLDFMVDFSEFSPFYDFVFFVCRENGQKNISKLSCTT
ncbi:hypothetical protein Gohar_020183 [Gossypium harknessii]|uniref:Uncharacterized protein n=1 Tax=Gossypium harknessii TaxID=34285 RepID=A0A7J9HWW8_9ROSI|nr:hypothetical protein [Gossypium harknessii]